MRKRRISCRINYFNYDLVRSIADVLFKENFSKALDFILFLFRTNTHYSTTTKLLRYKALYDRGVRTREVLNGVRELETLIKIIQDETENIQKPF